jgi:MOSC domain-containing protein YiiM
MHLISVNIGKAHPIQSAKASGKTGIYKRSVNVPVQVTSNGLVGDVVCDAENHGGMDQAVYVYGTPDYVWWAKEVGHDLSHGTFGENLTITELESAQMCIGDRLHIGSVTLEVTAPRIPCVTLARRMNDPTFVKRFRKAERPGIYCRVLREGYVHTDDLVRHERYHGARVKVIELFRDFFASARSEATLRRHLAAPIAVRDRVEKEQQLQALTAHKNDEEQL